MITCGSIRARWEPLDGTAQRAAIHHDTGIDVVITGVGGGKTQLAAFKMLSWALRHPRREDGRPTNWLVLGPDFPTVGKVQLESIVERCRETNVGEKGIIKKCVAGNQPRLELWNGVQILGKSGTHPNALRNHEFDGFWMDEAAVMSEEAFSIAMTRLRASSVVRAIITSSPQANWLWKIANDEGDAYSDLRKRTPFRLHRWKTTENKTNNADVIATIDAALRGANPDLAAQELDGLFLGTEVRRDVFRGLDLAFGGQHKERLTGDKQKAYVVGVDLGQSRDWTWFVAMNRQGVVLAQERFKGDTVNVDRRHFYPFVEQRLFDFVQLWGAKRIKVDEALHGKAFVQNLHVSPRARGIRIDGYRTDQPSRKAEAITALDVAFGRGDLRIPDNWIDESGREISVSHVGQLRREINELVVEDLSSGRRRYDHPSGGHDDGVVALALAWQEVSQIPTKSPLPDLSLLAKRKPTPPELLYKFGPTVHINRWWA